jgi:hypothetical protein
MCIWYLYFWMHWFLFLACELCRFGRYFFWSKFLVNKAEISSITTGFPLGFLSPFIQQMVLLSQKTQHECLCPDLFQPTICNKPQIWL